MKDQRAEALAQILVHYSTKVKKGETVVLQASTTAEPLAQAVYEEILRAGAFPVVQLSPEGAAAAFYELANDEQLEWIPPTAAWAVEQADVRIAILGGRERVSDGADLQHHDADCMRDDVVKLSRDPRALLGHCDSRSSIPLPLGTALEETDPSHAQPLTLAAIPLGVTAKVVSLGVDEELRAWIRAVGIREGERLVVNVAAVYRQLDPDQARHVRMAAQYHR